ncbi:hypothetical protein IWW50_002012 [Coemansia erecta]|nr:hypothetical protein IWW50_002012 [Coemansia erecta]
MVFETTHRITQRQTHTHGYRELHEHLGNATLMHAPTNVGVVRMEYPAPARSTSVGGEGEWLIEYTGNVVAVVQAQNVVWMGEFMRDVRAVWWVDSQTVGVVTGSAQPGVLALFVIDVSGARVGEERLIANLELVVRDSRARGIAHVATQGAFIVCAVDTPGGSLLWHWHIDVAEQSGKLPCVVGSGQAGDECTGIVGLRWIGKALGLAATRSGGRWFALAPSMRVSDVACDLRALDTLSWRWQQSVIAVGSASSVPPDTPILCLPAPTGVSFYSLGAEGPPRILRLRQSFPVGWVWLCGSTTAYVILSPCRRKATVCCMPLSQQLYTVEIHGADVIQDGWMLGDSTACALSTGASVYFCQTNVP